MANSPQLENITTVFPIPLKEHLCCGEGAELSVFGKLFAISCPHCRRCSGFALSFEEAAESFNKQNLDEALNVFKHQTV